MTSRNVRQGFMDGWESGLIEQVVGDSTRIDRHSIAEAYNVRYDETGTFFGRTGITSRITGLPNIRCSVDEFRSSTKNALICSDGLTIYVLKSTGWTSIGTFANDGGRASLAFMNKRMYVANGINATKVVDYISSAWNVRDVGVAAPASAPTATFTGSGATTDSFMFAYSYVDDRGFESNISPLLQKDSVYVTNPSFTLTLVAGGSGISFINIYGSIRNQRQVYYIKQIANGTSATVDGQNLSRDENIEGPTDHNQPGSGIYSLYSHKDRMYAAQKVEDSYYSFSKISEPEYWPTAFAQDLGVPRDPSNVVNFAVSSLGLMIWKTTSALILEGDPESVSAPQPILQGAGLSQPDGLISLNGVVFAITQRGLIAHDGVRSVELWRRIKQSSGYAVAATRIVTAFSDVRAHFFFKDPVDSNKIYNIQYDIDKKRFSTDKIAVNASPSSVVDVTRNFTTDATVSAHESVENGAQTIASGGGTTTPVLSGTMSSKAIAGTFIKFVGSATIFYISVVAGNTITIDGVAPANTTAVDYIRGTQVTNGSLTLTGV
jgi:hypothetical protein